MQTVKVAALCGVLFLLDPAGDSHGPRYAPLDRPDPKGELIHSENFESGGWDEKFWLPNWCHFDYSCKNISNPIGSGRVFRAEYRPDNCTEARETMGDELATRQINYDEQWLGFRIYFDEELFGFDSQPMILVQHHGLPDDDLGETWRNPVTALEYRYGELTLTYRGSKESVTPKEDGRWVYSEKGIISLGAVKLNAWNNFVIHTVWDPTGNSGVLEIWHDGKPYLLKDINISYNDARQPYIKFGQYNWRCASDDPVRISYYDDVIIVGGPQAGFCDVVPPGSLLPDNIYCK